MLTMINIFITLFFIFILFLFFLHYLTIFTHWFAFSQNYYLSYLLCFYSLFSADLQVIESVKKVDDLYEKINRVQAVASDLPALILRYDLPIYLSLKFLSA